MVGRLHGFLFEERHMRQHIDLAWLRDPAHQDWVDSALSDLKPALQRIDIHELGWLEGHFDAQGQSADATHTPESIVMADSSRLLSRSVVQLRRYDALLISVSIDNLAWARQSLAALPKSPTVPIVALVNGLRSGALVDLIELGLADFVRWPACGQEFRARLITAVCRSPRYIPLREGVLSSIYGHDPRRAATSEPRALGWPLPNPLRVSELYWPLRPYQESKRRIFDLFERQYLRAALRQTQGNISAAARLAKINRRTFFELLRRHDIKAGAGRNLQYNR